ncbi:MAG: D-alanyl-D-alanine carboxypeptidase [Clostridia bacterium]|nr:D-alanyl-D-alanine carboxypeptidase [Clostridia bacterium]
MKKNLISFLLVVTIIFSCGFSALSYSAKGVCVVELESGDVYAEKNADTSYAPASLTKIMTLYILFEKLESGEITKDTLVTASANVQKLSRAGDASNIPLTAGNTYTIDDMIKAMCLPSACAVCTMFAEFISGSEEAFALLMNEKSTELGLSFYFTDASGLSDYNRVTARSVAQLVRLFIQKYPDILNYTSLKEVTLNGKVYKNTNLLLSEKQFYEGADGFKTGTTTLAGKCLVATALKNDTRIISVTLGSSSNNTRYSDAKEGLNTGFTQAEYFNTNIFSTDIRTYINENEIPCYYFLGKNKSLLLRAEDLQDYGFDLIYTPEDNTVYLSYNNQKEATPLVLEENKVPGNPLYKLYTQSTPKVVLQKESGNIEFKTVYSINGYCFIDVDEFAKNFDYLWNNDNRSANISVK